MDEWPRTVGSFPFLCADIDECKMNNGGCQDKCINSPGSFSCLCTRLGFVVAADNKSCISEFVSLCVVRAVMPRTSSLTLRLSPLSLHLFFLSFFLFIAFPSFIFFFNYFLSLIHLFCTPFLLSFFHFFLSFLLLLLLLLSFLSFK